MLHSNRVRVNQSPLRIFIGYDSKESVAFSVLAHSLLRHATVPIAITPVKREHLGKLYTRERGPSEATEFSLTRFLVPYLSGYAGHSVFMDCDMLCKADIGDIWLYILTNPTKAVLVCQHDYTPKTDWKFLGQPQTQYPRKNWSSFMVFNNELCTALTPDYVNKAKGLELHRLLWTPEETIGSLPLEWNWLVGEYNSNDSANILHYTLGGPWFPDYTDCDHASEWLAERDLMLGKK